MISVSLIRHLEKWFRWVYLEVEWRLYGLLTKYFWIYSGGFFEAFVELSNSVLVLVFRKYFKMQKTPSALRAFRMKSYVKNIS